jgi:hypothetical protein
MMTIHEAETDLQRSGFRTGYAPCNGRWVKCYIPPNAIGPVRVPYREAGGVRTSLGREELRKLSMSFAVVE